MKQIYLKLYKDNGKVVQFHSSKSPQRILSRISLNNFKKAYLRVSYGTKIDCYKKKSEFFNDGYWTDPKELKMIAKIFWAEN